MNRAWMPTAMSSTRSSHVGRRRLFRPLEATPPPDSDIDHAVSHRRLSARASLVPQPVESHPMASRAGSTKRLESAAQATTHGRSRETGRGRQGAPAPDRPRSDFVEVLASYSNPDRVVRTVVAR